MNTPKSYITPSWHSVPLYCFIQQKSIDYFAIHPGKPKILEKIEELLDISVTQNAVAYNILKNYGNLSSQPAYLFSVSVTARSKSTWLGFV